jgi:hypothetical protein
MVLFFVVLVLPNCAKPVTPPRLTPAPIAGLVLGMTLSEVKKSIGEPWSDSIGILNRSGQRIEQIGFELYETEKNESNGKKTQYWLYFLCTEPESYKLVYWGEVAHWKKDVALLEKTRFINSSLPVLFRRGMTYKEVEKIYADKTQYPILPTPYTMSNRFGQTIWVYEFSLESDQSAKKTWYRAYFVGHNLDDFRLVDWAAEADWKKAETLVKKTRFK